MVKQKKKLKLKPKKAETKTKAKKVSRRKDGTLKKGSVLNPKGAPRKIELDFLKEALKAEGIKQKKDFYALVAEKCYEDTHMLANVLKKLVPDLKSIEGLFAGVSGRMTDEEAAEIQQELMSRFE